MMLDATPSMDLSLDPTQEQIVQAVRRILTNYGGAARAGRLAEAAGYDHELHRALHTGGYLDLALTEGLGPLEAALVVETVGQRAGLISAGAMALAYPCLTGETAPGPIALARDIAAPFRFATLAHSVLIDDGEEALLLELMPGEGTPVDFGRTGWPLGRLAAERRKDARSLGPGSGERLRAWWRVALALEAAGAMRGALDKTVQYAKERIQFDRPIGSFQAIQHRLAQMLVQVEGVRWLALKAAFDKAEPVAAAAAATWAMATSPLVFRETQQMHGAMGFTREYPLHGWTMRLPALQRELGGLSAHARDLARRRWAA